MGRSGSGPPILRSKLCKARRVDRLAGIFVGPLGELFGNNPAAKLARLLPTYYIADGGYNASQRLGSVDSNLLDIGVILGSTVVLIIASTWVLRRQSAVEAMI